MSLGACFKIKNREITPNSDTIWP